MISPALFRHRGFGSAIALNLIAAFGMMGSAFFTTQYLQSVLGKGALEAALWSLLPSIVVGVAAPVATTLVQRGANRAYVVCAGFVVAAAGYGALALAGTDSLVTVLIGAGILGAGIVTVMSQVTDLALGTAPVERAGSASSLLQTGQEFGGALGMALLGAIATAVYRNQASDTFPSGAPAEAHETLGGAAVAAQHLPGDAGKALLTAAREAFTSGMQLAMIAGTVLLLGAAVLTVVTLRHVRPLSPASAPANANRPEGEADNKAERETELV
jgi:DHA2 family multidrug resistance protein-like MFS transporter